MNTQGQTNKHTVRNLAIFTFLVITMGWLGRWLDSLMGTSPGIGQLVWIIAPLGVSFLLRAFAGDGWQDLGIRPNIRGNVTWYMVSILVYPVCTIIILAIGRASGAVSFPGFGPDTVGLWVQAFALFIVPQVITNIFEEFGFRGYLAPKMYKLGLNVFLAHVLVGLIWGVWHLPYLRVITPYTAESLATLIPRFLLGTMAASIVYGEIRLLTDSVWPSVLMQTAGGAFIGATVMSDLISISSGTEFLVLPVLEGLLTIVLFTLIGVGIYVVRRKRTRAIELGSAAG
jgi:membrane protease YdiL (CAAX protease family)